MKKKNYNIGIITLTLIFVFNLVLMSVSSVFAANPYGQTGAKNDIDKITFATRIKEAFVECLKNDSMVKDHSTDFGEDHHVNLYYVTPGEILKDNNVFTGGINAIDVGKDIEEKINPGNRDGKIYCNEGSSEKNLTTLFMDYMGIDSIKRLVCSSSGTYALYNIRLSKNADDPCSVDNLDLNTLLEKKDSNKSIEYINDIYSKWSKKQDNNILTGDSEKDKVSNNATMSYTKALNAFEKECLGQPGVSKDGSDKEQYLSKKGTYYYDFSIKMIKDGNAVELFPHLGQDKDGNDFNKSGTYPPVSGKLTCKDLADTINNNFDEYKKSIDSIRKEKYVKPCASEEIKKRASEIVSAYEAQVNNRIEGGLNSKAPKKLLLMSVDKTEYDTLKSALSSGDFTVDDGNGGRKCLETKNLKNCNSAEMRTKAQRIIDEYDRKIVNGESLTDAENKEFKILSAALPKNDFTVDDGNGGKKCLETENFNSTLPPDEAEWNADAENDSSATDEQKQSYCQENGGFLSWMLCPAIADGASTTSGLLGYITSLTTVHDSIIKQFDDQGSSIYKAWSTFRNIANIGFVIMLLVVVFSQVTNVGISNYNIKKILPKLIVTAILVNFSYLILGVLIDLSHIVGNGVGSLIRSVAVDSMDADASARAADLITKIAGMVTGVAGAAGIGAVLLSGPALILPVVMFIVTALISVFFGFITLTIRQAAIIMVIVLAPLMMVLYALPNTSAITKKYLSIVKSLLMLYPMFIFATSAGALASSVIVGTSDDPLMMIVGGLLNVLPYFAIPSMTSKSLAGLGAITGAFDKIRGGALKGAGMAGGAIGASEFYKNMKSNFAADKEVKRAERKLRGYDNMRKSNKALSSGQMRDRARAVEILNKDSKMRAGGDYAASTALNNFSGSGFENLENLAKDEAMEYQDKILMSSYRNSGKSEAELAADLKKEMETSYKGATAQEKEAHDSRIRALTRVVGATKSGQKLINGMMADSDLKTSGRAMTQLDHASSSIPGFADKHQVLTGQLTSLRGTSQATGEDTVEGLANQLRAEGTEFALSNINGDKLNAMSNSDASELKATGDARFNAALNQLAETGIKNPDIINGLDGAKYEMVHEAQGKIADMMNQTTINLRSGGTAQVFNPPSDFGEYSQAKNHAGEIVYTNKRGDEFNASTGQITKGV